MIRGRKVILSEEQTYKIIETYNSELSLFDTGKLFNLSSRFIWEFLVKNNIKIRKHSDIRKHQLDEYYFDNIDSEEKAYFLGLLFADGNVNSKYNSIDLKLHERDKDILIKFSHIIFGKEILYNKNNNQFLFRISSKRIKDRLIELGCIPRKSLKIVYPNIEEKYNNHFIRGYFDGDGCISYYGKDYDLTIISTENFCNSMLDIINNNTEIIGKMRKDKTMLAHGNNITTYLRYRGNRRVEKVMGWIYKDATIYFERKHNKYLNLKKWIEEVDLKKQFKNN